MVYGTGNIQSGWDMQEKATESFVSHSRTELESRL